MGQQESKYREATLITEDLRIKILHKLAEAEKHVKELTKVVSATRYEQINSVDFLLVLTELFETLGGVLGTTHPNSYIELLTDQFEIAKNGMKAFERKETCSHSNSLDPSPLNHSPILRRRSTRPKVNLLDLKSLTLPIRSSRTERGWFDFSKNQVLCLEDIIRSCYCNSDRQRFANIRQYCSLYTD